MFYFISAWTFLIIACCLIGTALLNMLKADSFERVGDRLIAAVWLGVFVLSISLLATSLVLPLSPLVGAVITVSISSLSFVSQRTRTEIIALWSVLSPLPPQLPRVELLQKQVNDITYFFPNKDLCWAAELPCAFEIQEDIKLRDPARGIKAGFVRKKLSVRKQGSDRLTMHQHVQISTLIRKFTEVIWQR